MYNKKMNTLPTDIIRDIISYNNPKLETLLIGKERCNITDNLLCMYNLTRIQLIKKTFNNNDIIEIYDKQNKFVTYARIGEMARTAHDIVYSGCRPCNSCAKSYHYKIFVTKLTKDKDKDLFGYNSSGWREKKSTNARRFENANSYNPKNSGMKYLQQINLKKYTIKHTKDDRKQTSYFNNDYRFIKNCCKNYSTHRCIDNEYHINWIYTVVHIGNNLLVTFKDFIEICDNLEQNSIKDELYKHSFRFMYPYHIITDRVWATEDYFRKTYDCDALPDYRQFIYIKEKAEEYDKSLTENDLISYYMRSLKKTHTHKTDE